MKVKIFLQFLLAVALLIGCSDEDSNEMGAKLSLNYKTLTMTKKATALLVATLSEDLNASEIKWSSTDDQIAKVDDRGEVTAVGIGQATVTASVDTYSASCEITVKGIEVRSLSLDKERLNMMVGETEQLNATIQPLEAEGTISWSCDDNQVATVDDQGVVTAVKEGVANITAEINGKTAECQVIVNTVFAGSWYYSDGSYSRDLDLEKTPIGIVFWVGDPTENDPVLKAAHPQCTHGLVVSLYDTKGYWQKEPQYNELKNGISINGNTVKYSSISDWRRASSSELPWFDISVGKAADDNLNKIVGYNNTYVLKQFNEYMISNGKPDYVVSCIHNNLSQYEKSTPAPSKSSGWYMPSVKEVSILYSGEFEDLWNNKNPKPDDNFILINEKLTELINSNSEEFKNVNKLAEVHHITSSEWGADGKYVMRIAFDGSKENYGGSVYYLEKWAEHRIRFVLAF